MRLNLIYITIVSILLISCQKNAKQEKVLSVSIDPQKYFLESIVGDKFKVNSLIPAGSNPETFDPTPAQMVSLGKSVAFFKVGFLSFENVLEKNVKHNTPNMLIIDCSENIEPIEAACVDHKHHQGGGHDGADPHIWSSPKTAKIIAENMYNTVINLDSLNKDYYTGNYNRLITKIDSVDNIIRNQLQNSNNKSFIIYHPALSYFAEEYGLEQYPIEFEGKNPSPSQLKQLIDLAHEHNVKVVFVQAEYDAKNAETLAREINAKVVPINLLSYDWDHQMINITNALTK